MVGAKQQGRNAAAIGIQAFHRQIHRGAVRLGIQAGLRLGNRLQLRDNALFVVVEADAEIDLVAAGIVFEFFHQREDGIAGVGVNVLKHAMVLLESVM